MNGNWIAELDHFALLLPTQSISGGKTAGCIALKNAEHLSVIIQFGTMGAAVPTSIVLNQCSTAAGATPSALPFRWYNQPPGAGLDVCSAYTYSTTSGIVSFPTSIANYTYLIEMDASELGDLGLPYVQVVINDSGNATTATVIGILSGLRNSFTKNVSQTI